MPFSTVTRTTLGCGEGLLAFNDARIFFLRLHNNLFRIWQEPSISERNARGPWWGVGEVRALRRGIRAVPRRVSLHDTLVSQPCEHHQVWHWYHDCNPWLGEFWDRLEGEDILYDKQTVLSGYAQLLTQQTRVVQAMAFRHKTKHVELRVKVLHKCSVMWKERNHHRPSMEESNSAESQASTCVWTWKAPG